MKLLEQTLLTCLFLLSTNLCLKSQICIDNPSFSETNIPADQLSEYTTFAAGDMDNDGDFDIIAVAAVNSGALLYYENDGSQNFTFHAVVETNLGTIYDIALGDLDCDGQLDIALSNTSKKRIEIFTNQGQGDFALTAVFSSIDDPRDIKILDLDRNGTMDIIYANAAIGELVAQFNDGKNNYTKTVLATGSILIGATTFDAGDWDHDGDIDLVLGVESENKVYTVMNNGSNIFATSLINVDAVGVRKLALEDMDKDGDLDILATLFTGNKVVWYEQINPGFFFTQYLISDDLNKPLIAIPTDVDGDGDQDIVAAFSGSNSLVQFINTGNHLDYTKKVINSDLTGISMVFDFDFDKDGDTDILSGSKNKASFNLYKNNCEHCTTIEYPKEDIATNFSTLKTAKPVDWDNDGDLDVIAIKLNTDEIFLLTNDGQQNFSQQTIATLPNAHGINTLAVGDMDNDGDLDVVGCHFDSNTLFWYENTGSATLTYHLIDGNLARTLQVEIVDLDKDGLNDIVIPAQLSAGFGGAVVYENSSTQSFKRTLLSNPAIGVTQISVVDIDKDGDLDIATTSFIDQDDFEWLENTGGFNFTTHSIVNKVRPNEILAVDFDKDGDIDFVTLNDDQFINLHENNGNQVFTERSIFSAFEDLISIDVADIDYDGDVDVLIGRRMADLSGLAYWLKNSNMVFSSALLTTNVGGFSQIETSDLDCDGDKDIILTSFFDGTVQWLDIGCDFECKEAVLTVSNRTVQPDTYHGINSLSSENAIVEEMVTFKAGTSITLEPGFHAQAGSDFLAMIESCLGNFTENEEDLAIARNINLAEESLLVEKNTLKIAPNPTRGATIIDFNLQSASTVHLTLHNLQGASVQTFVAGQSKEKGAHQVTFFSSDLVPGIYMVHLKTSTEVLTQKVVVTK